MSWLGTWEKRIKVTVSNTNIDTANLTHFPLLLSLGTSVGTGSTDVSCVFDELTSDANRKKIAITKTDGTTQLYGEIEKWDDANEKAWIWVSKSDFVLDYDATTDVYLYYDSTQDDNTTYIGDTNDVVAESVWDSNFKAVYHMSDGADTSHIYDSTSNDNDGTKKGANEPNQVDGLVGKAQDFDGNDDYIDLGNTASMDWATQLTVEALIKTDVTNEVNMIISKYNTVGSNREWYIRNNLQVLQVNIGDPNDGTFEGQQSSDNNVITSTAVYYHVSFAFSANNVDIYVDGAEVASSTTIGAIPASLYNGAASLMLGLQNAGTSDWWKGLEDEVRISNIARSAGWIKATHYSLIDGLVSWGSEEEAPSTFTPKIIII